MSKSYNYIFRELVRDENDLVGLIAYGLYKKHKIEFIESFKAANAGQEPADSDCRAFATISCTQSSLNHYRDTAESLLQQITLTAAREEINTFEDDMLHQYRSEISLALKSDRDETVTAFADAVRRNTPGWWSSVVASVVGALAFSIFVYLGYWLGSTSEQNTVKLISNTIETVTNSNSPDTIAPSEAPTQINP